MKNINIVLLKIVSLLNITYGVFILVKNFGFFLFTLNNFQNVTNETSIMVTLSSMFFALILPILYIGGGIGVFYLYKWGRRIILSCLVVTIIFDLYGLVAMVSNSTKMKFQEMEMGTVIITKSLMPDYMISILAVVCFVFLLRQKISFK